MSASFSLQPRSSPFFLDIFRLSVFSFSPFLRPDLSRISIMPSTGVCTPLTPRPFLSFSLFFPLFCWCPGDPLWSNRNRNSENSTWRRGISALVCLAAMFSIHHTLTGPVRAGEMQVEYIFWSREKKRKSEPWPVNQRCWKDVQKMPRSSKRSCLGFLFFSSSR